jgi:hypothetical protein
LAPYLMMIRPLTSTFSFWRRSMRRCVEILIDKRSNSTRSTYASSQNSSFSRLRSKR